MAEITIIVPVYNVEKYLRKCVESILAQTFTDFQLILVDDGSQDGSAVICDEYVSSDARICVVHKNNGGVSSARNSAIDLCESPYIAFCDSDDYLATDWLESLHETIVSRNADVVSADIQCVTEEGQFINATNYEKGSYLIRNESERIDFLIHQILEFRLGWAVYTRLFKTGIIREHGIRFCETCENYAEDLCFTLEYSLFCKRIETCHSNGYYYVQHQGSMMASSKDTFKLNAANEVSKQFGMRYFSAADSIAGRDAFPVMHYLIFRPEYRKILRNGEANPSHADTREIRDYPWYRSWTCKVFSSTKTFCYYLGKENTKEAVRNALLCLFHLWGPYDLYKKVKTTIAGKRK